MLASKPPGREKTRRRRTGGRKCDRRAGLEAASLEYCFILRASPPCRRPPFFTSGGLEVWSHRSEVRKKVMNADTLETTTQTLEEETLGFYMKPIWASEGFNVVAKWVESRFKMAPWRFLGEPWAALGQPSGGPGALRQIIERFWVPSGTPFGG